MRRLAGALILVGLALPVGCGGDKGVDIKAECSSAMFGNFAMNGDSWTQAQRDAAQAVRKDRDAFVVAASAKDARGFITARGDAGGVSWRCMREPDIGTVSFNWGS